MNVFLHWKQLLCTMCCLDKFSLWKTQQTFKTQMFIHLHFLLITFTINNTKIVLMCKISGCNTFYTIQKSHEHGWNKDRRMHSTPPLLVEDWMLTLDFSLGDSFRAQVLKVTDRFLSNILNCTNQWLEVAKGIGLIVLTVQNNGHRWLK